MKTNAAGGLFFSRASKSASCASRIDANAAPLAPRSGAGPGASRPGERGVGVEVVRVDVRRRALSLGQEEQVGVHPVELNAVVFRRVLVQVGRRLAHLPRKEVVVLEVDEVILARALLGGVSLVEDPDVGDVRRLRQQIGDARGERAGGEERKGPKERALRARREPLPRPRDEQEPLEVDARRHGVEVVRKPFALDEHAHDAADRKERDRERAARELTVDHEPDHHGRVGEREGGRRPAPSQREDLARRAREHEAIHRRDVVERDPQPCAEIAVVEDEGELGRGAQHAARAEERDELERSHRQVPIEQERQRLDDGEQAERRLAEPGDHAERARERERGQPHAPIFSVAELGKLALREELQSHARQQEPERRRSRAARDPRRDR